MTPEDGPSERRSLPHACGSGPGTPCMSLASVLEPRALSYSILELSSLGSPIDAGFSLPHAIPESPLLSFDTPESIDSKELLAQALSDTASPDPLALSSLGSNPATPGSTPVSPAAPCPFNNALIHMASLTDGNHVSTY